MSVKERIKEYVKYKKISIRSFEKTVGLSFGYVNNIRVSIQPDKMMSIAHYFPDLNTGWLMTGEGDMLRIVAETINLNNDDSFIVSKKAWDLIEKQTQIIFSQQQTIENLSHIGGTHQGIAEGA